MNYPEKYKKEYILLTGGAGYIGSSVAYYLLLKSKNVIIIDNFSNSNRNNLNKLPNQQNLLSFNIDCCNIASMEHIFISYKISTIIHLAGFKAVSESIEKPLLYYQNNLISTIHLLNLVKVYNIPKFIFSSSATVYGNLESPLSEDNKVGLDISNPYGQTKYMIERIITDVSKTIENTQFIILRYFNPIGTINNGLITDNHTNKPNNLMPIIINSIITKTKFQIFGSDYNTIDGTAARDYIHIEDLALGHISAIDFINPIGNFEIFNLGTGNPHTVLEIVKTFEKINSIQLNYTIGYRRPGDLESIYCSSKKANKILGWKAKKTIEEMCDFRYLFK